jgi:hypothetical protein
VKGNSYDLIHARQVVESEATMERTIHRVEARNGRSGAAHGYAFIGWEYEEGWLITFWLIGRDPASGF